MLGIYSEYDWKDTEPACKHDTICLKTCRHCVWIMFGIPKNYRHSRWWWNKKITGHCATTDRLWAGNPCVEEAGEAWTAWWGLLQEEEARLGSASERCPADASGRTGREREGGMGMKGHREREEREREREGGIQTVNMTLIFGASAINLRMAWADSIISQWNKNLRVNNLSSHKWYMTERRERALCQKAGEDDKLIQRLWEGKENQQKHNEVDIWCASTTFEQFSFL